MAQLKERGLYDSLQEAVAMARYGVYPEARQLASWQAQNPAQHYLMAPNQLFSAQGAAFGADRDLRSG